MNTKFLKQENGRIAYDEQGSGPLVICVPSMGDVRAEYRFLIPQLVAAGYRSVSMDVRGMGETSTGWDDFSVAGVGKDMPSSRCAARRPARSPTARRSGAARPGCRARQANGSARPRSIARGRDDLARGALLERNKASEAAQLLDRDLEILHDTLAKLGSDVTALQAKIKDAKARQNAIILRGKAGQARLGARRQLSDHNIDDALQRFENYERKMDDLEGQIESYDLGRRSLAEEIAELEASERIDAELEQLKARMRSKGTDPFLLTPCAC